VVLFTKVFSDLFHLYKQKWKSKDNFLTKRCYLLRDIQPSHLGVDPNLWLEEKAESITEEMYDPYIGPIKTLRKLTFFVTPREKLMCLSQVSKDAVTCVQSYNQINGKRVVIGGDEIFPLFMYIVIKANIPHMYSEAALLYSFIGDLATGELGYALTTFQACLDYILILSFKDIRGHYDRCTPQQFNENKIEIKEWRAKSPPQTPEKEKQNHLEYPPDLARSFTVADRDKKYYTDGAKHQGKKMKEKRHSDETDKHKMEWRKKKGE